jgi:hypothetical protein
MRKILRWLEMEVVWGRSVRSELRPLRLAPLHNPSDPEKVLAGAPDQEKVQALLRLYEKVTRT